MTDDGAAMPTEVAAVRARHETGRGWLTAERVAGHWVGELSASALATATAVSALALASRGREPPEPNTSKSQIADFQQLIDGGVKYLIAQQNDDGGWGDTDKSYSNIATTYLCVAAL